MRFPPRFLFPFSVCLLALFLGTGIPAGAAPPAGAALPAGVSKRLFKPRYIKKRLLKVADWQLAHPKHALTDWTNGAFYAGVFAAYEATQSPKILDSLMAMGERNRWLPAPKFGHADDIAISQTYLNLYRLKKDRRMIQATIDTVAKLRRLATNPEKEKHGITWWWCDALFMAPPLLTKMSVTLNDPSYFTFSDSLYHQTYERLYHKEQHLFARDARYLATAEGEGKRKAYEANGQLVFWSRGNGWVIGGLALLLNELPADHPRRGFYVTLFQQMSAKLAELQQPDGLWRGSLLDPAAYPGGEGSGSGFDCFAMAWGINHGLLDRARYLPVVQKAWAGLNGLVSAEGRVGWVQPIGGDPRRNFNAESYEVYGAGAYLLAGSEVIKLAQ
ncbi:glycosyl hydrolase family 88 [Hymenobacter roseosalivarius DSM 11622]|uniref:Glycosyl hydrolase family 88 n=1 Tax=Hymenobacter roseosalivarius DSM 11622 TaxID=645990 RepID=A0A1W1UI21_9BACT|nr:glycoside hydrolase family 88 protein [Hymenobacter roseosalivarius]SMB80717.1 glycosyl hydrolase family 88 [Hymenobacter roseosalivarius DSM 11622]